MEGQPVVVVQDPLGLIEGQIILSHEMLNMVKLLESSETIADLQLLLTRLQGGQLITQDEIQQIVDELDDSFLLKSEKFERAYRDLIEAFQKEPVRESICMGSCYPEDPEELKEELQETLENAPCPELQGPLLAVAAPHIDLRVGMDTYGKAYKILEKASPEVVILLGVGHAMDDAFFSITSKDFLTPLGRVTTHKELANRLMKVDSPGVSKHDFVHKQEHSLEFQILFLQHLLGENFQILPILCGSFYHYLNQYSRAGEIPDVVPFLDELKAILGELGPKGLVVAGVDLSHVGLKFGDEQTAEEILPQSESHDRALLKALCEKNPQAFWAESQRVEDQYHVCGFAVLATLLEILPPCRGEITDYQIWREEPTQSAVSFCGAVFEEI